MTATTINGVAVQLVEPEEYNQLWVANRFTLHPKKLTNQQAINRGLLHGQLAIDGYSNMIIDGVVYVAKDCLFP